MSDGTTHWEDCWRQSDHWRCAVARAEAAEAREAQLREALERVVSDYGQSCDGECADHRNDYLGCSVYQANKLLATPSPAVEKIQRDVRRVAAIRELAAEHVCLVDHGKDTCGMKVEAMNEPNADWTDGFAAEVRCEFAGAVLQRILADGEGTP